MAPEYKQHLIEALQKMGYENLPFKKKNIKDIKISEWANF